jgi:hypothetical protein
MNLPFMTKFPLGTGILENVETFFVEKILVGLYKNNLIDSDTFISFFQNAKDLNLKNSYTGSTIKKVINDTK